MKYRVLLDTNIYDAANYSFRNAQFTRLVSLSKAGQLSVVINSVIEGEVRSHINERIRKVVGSLGKVAKDCAFAGFRNVEAFKEKLLIPEASEWTDYVLNEFSEFLSSCSVRHIPLNGIDVESVIKDYFLQRFPFEQKKPDEFKDAIAVKSLVLDIQQAWEEPATIQYCVISEDKGFISAVKEAIKDSNIEDYTMLFASLIDFTDYLAEMDKQMQFMLRYLQSDYGKEFLHDIVKQVLEESSYEIECENEIIDQETVDVEIESVEPHTVSLTNTAGIPDILETVIDGVASISVDYTYNDDDESFYDKETHSYLYVVSKSIAAIYKLSFSIPMSFVADGCLAEDEEIENKDDLVFEKKKMALDLYEEQSFELSEGNRISYEIIETTDDGSYSTCPDCGRRIGIENDGGNGFCIECAINY